MNDTRNRDDEGCPVCHVPPARVQVALEFLQLTIGLEHAGEEHQNSRDLTADESETKDTALSMLRDYFNGTLIEPGLPAKTKKTKDKKLSTYAPGSPADIQESEKLTQ